MREPLVYQKNAEKTTNKIRLPKQFCETKGYNFIMKIYQDRIELIPIEKKGK